MSTLMPSEVFAELIDGMESDTKQIFLVKNMLCVRQLMLGVLDVHFASHDWRERDCLRLLEDV